MMEEMGAPEPLEPKEKGGKSPGLGPGNSCLKITLGITTRIYFFVSNYRDVNSFVYSRLISKKLC